MPFMDWVDEFSVGVEEIDRDHKKLLELLNELHDAVQAGEGREVLGKVLEGLTLYVSYHFSREEVLFLRTDYPDYEKHRKQHLALANTVEEVYEDFHSGMADTLPHQVLDFLKNWLNDHILRADKAFGAYLKANPALLERAASLTDAGAPQ